MWFQLLSSSTESEYSSLSWLPTADVGEWTCTPVFPVPLELSSSVTEDPDREELFAVVAWSMVMLKLVARATVSDGVAQFALRSRYAYPIQNSNGQGII